MMVIDVGDGWCWWQERSRWPISTLPSDCPTLKKIHLPLKTKKSLQIVQVRRLDRWMKYSEHLTEMMFPKNQQRNMKMGLGLGTNWFASLSKIFMVFSVIFIEKISCDVDNFWPNSTDFFWKHAWFWANQISVRNFEAIHNRFPIIYIVGWLV